MSNESSDKPVFSELKDRALLVGWIAGLIIIGALMWTLTRPLLSTYLLRTVNQSLIAQGESRRITSPLPRPPLKAAPLGIWYALDNSSDVMFVFAIMHDGIMIPCGAQVTPQGRVTEIIPLSAHARRVFNRLPGGAIRIYTRRIEDVAGQWSRR